MWPAHSLPVDRFHFCFHSGREELKKKRREAKSLVGKKLLRKTRYGRWFCSHWLDWNWKLGLYKILSNSTRIRGGGNTLPLNRGEKNSLMEKGGHLIWRNGKSRSRWVKSEKREKVVQRKKEEKVYVSSILFHDGKWLRKKGSKIRKLTDQIYTPARLNTMCSHRNQCLTNASWGESTGDKGKLVFNNDNLNRH